MRQEVGGDDGLFIPARPASSRTTFQSSQEPPARLHPGPIRRCRYSCLFCGPSPKGAALREPRTGSFACVRAERVAGSTHSGRVWRTRRPVELITPLRDRDVRFHSFSIPRFSRKASRQMVIYDDEITTSSYAVSYKPPQSQTSFEIYLSYLRFLFLS